MSVESTVIDSVTNASGAIVDTVAENWRRLLLENFGMMTLAMTSMVIATSVLKGLADSYAKPKAAEKLRQKEDSSDSEETIQANVVAARVAYTLIAMILAGATHAIKVPFNAETAAAFKTNPLFDELQSITVGSPDGITISVGKNLLGAGASSIAYIKRTTFARLGTALMYYDSEVRVTANGEDKEGEDRPGVRLLRFLDVMVRKNLIDFAGITTSLFIYNNINEILDQIQDMSKEVRFGLDVLNGTFSYITMGAIIHLNTIIDEKLADSENPLYKKKDKYIPFTAMLLRETCIGATFSTLYSVLGALEITEIGDTGIPIASLVEAMEAMLRVVHAEYFCQYQDGSFVSVIGADV